jgi:hypothetical protein
MTCDGLPQIVNCDVTDNPARGDPDSILVKTVLSMPLTIISQPDESNTGITL